MDRFDPHLSVRLAETETDRLAAHRLRYAVFVEELGGSGALVDHDHRFERDRFDPYFDHLILVDDRRDAMLSGVYPGGLLSAQQEPGTIYFQQLVREALGGFTKAEGAGANR